MCPTLCDPRDGSPPGSPVPGILQVRTLEWVAISFSNAWKWKVKVKSLRLSTWKLYSRVQLLATPLTAVYQAPLSMGFSRQEYWSGVPLPSPISLIVTTKKKKIYKRFTKGKVNEISIPLQKIINLKRTATIEEEKNMTTTRHLESHKMLLLLTPYLSTVTLHISWLNSPNRRH